MYKKIRTIFIIYLFLKKRCWKFTK